MLLPACFFIAFLSRFNQQATAKSTKTAGVGKCTMMTKTLRLACSNVLWRDTHSAQQQNTHKWSQDNVRRRMRCGHSEMYTCSSIWCNHPSDVCAASLNYMELSATVSSTWSSATVSTTCSPLQQSQLHGALLQSQLHVALCYSLNYMELCYSLNYMELCYSLNYM